MQSENAPRPDPPDDRAPGFLHKLRLSLLVLAPIAGLGLAGTLSAGILAVLLLHRRPLPGVDPSGHQLEVGAFLFLSLALVGPLSALLGRWSQRRIRAITRGPSPRAVLEQNQDLVAEVCRQGEVVREIWEPPSPLRTNLHKAVLLPMFLVLGQGAILVCAAMTTGEGLPGVLLAKGLLLLLPLLYLTTPGPSRITDVVFLFLPVPLAFLLAMIQGDMRGSALLGVLPELLILVFLVTGLLGVRRQWVRAGRKQLLIETDRGWRLVSRGGPGGLLDESTPVPSLDTDRPLGMRRDEESIDLDLPLSDGTTAPLALASSGDLERLRRRAPPAWRASIEECPEQALPVVLPRRFAVYLAGCLGITYLVVLGLELGERVVPHLDTWTEGNPDPLNAALLRTTERFPFSSIGWNLRGATELERGDPTAALAAAERGYWLSGGEGVSAEFSRRLLEPPRARKLLEDLAALDDLRPQGSPPEGVPEGAWRARERARAYEAVLLGGPLTLPQQVPALVVVRGLEQSLDLASGDYPEARLHLVRLLGRVAWPLARSAPSQVPAPRLAPWSERALELLDAGEVPLSPDRRAALRGRILYRSGRLGEALPYLEASSDPQDQLRLVSALRSFPGRRREARDLLTRLQATDRAGPDHPELLDDLLDAEEGVAPPVRSSPLGQLLHPLFLALADPSAPAGPGPLPDRGDEDQEGGPPVELPPWLQDLDLALLWEVSGRARYPGPAPWREDRGLQAASTHEGYPGQDLARRLLRGPSAESGERPGEDV